jgi:hypothetical protein
MKNVWVNHGQSVAQCEICNNNCPTFVRPFSISSSVNGFLPLSERCILPSMMLGRLKWPMGQGKSLPKRFGTFEVTLPE